MLKTYTSVVARALAELRPAESLDDLEAYAFSFCHSIRFDRHSGAGDNLYVIARDWAERHYFSIRLTDEEANFLGTVYDMVSDDD